MANATIPWIRRIGPFLSDRHPLISLLFDENDVTIEYVITRVLHLHAQLLTWIGVSGLTKLPLASTSWKFSYRWIFIVNQQILDVFEAHSTLTFFLTWYLSNWTKFLSNINSEHSASMVSFLISKLSMLDPINVLRDLQWKLSPHVNIFISLNFWKFY